MAGSNLLDNCRFNPTAGGTTDWTYSSAVTGYLSPVGAGAVNTAQYSYRAESLDKTQWEIGIGAWTTSTTILARTTVLFNSAGTGTLQSGAGSKISFTAAPQVAVVALAEDLGGGAWNSSTPAVTMSSGTATCTMRWKQIGKVVFINLAITCTASGTFASVPVPVALNAVGLSQSYLVGREVVHTGTMWWASISGSALGAGTYNNGAAVMTTGDVLFLSGSYEAA